MTQPGRLCWGVIDVTQTISNQRPLMCDLIMRNVVFSGTLNIEVNVTSLWVLFGSYCNDGIW